MFSVYYKRAILAMIVWQLDLQLHMQSVPISTWSGWRVQRYVIKFISDLRQVGGFLRVLRFPPPIKLIATI